MEKYVVPVSMPQEAYDAVKKARTEAEMLPYALNLNVLIAAMTAFILFAVGLNLSDFQHKDTFVLVESVVTIPLLLVAWSRTIRWTIGSMRIRKTFKLVRAGSRVDSVLADPLVVSAIAADIAEERFNKMVNLWLKYQQCLEDDKEIEDESRRMKPIENEERVRDSLIATGTGIQEYANDVGKELRRRSRNAELSKLLLATQDDSLSDAFENLRDYGGRLREAIQRSIDASAAPRAELLLAEPIALANLDALDEELRALPTRPAQPTNG